jgi:hypothetical protein
MPEWRNWQTRTTQNRVSKDVWVQVPPPAQKYENARHAFFNGVDKIEYQTICR